MKNISKKSKRSKTKVRLWSCELRLTCERLKLFQKFRLSLMKINKDERNGRKWVSFVDVQRV